MHYGNCWTNFSIKQLNKYNYENELEPFIDLPGLETGTGNERKIWLISRVANPSEWVQMTAVKKDASFIGLIAHPTEKVQMTVVKNYRGSICHIQYPTENMQLYVVKGNPKEIRNIQRPTERVQLAAVRKDPYVITEIMRPCQEACKEAIKKYFGDIGPVNNSPALVVATQKLFKQLLEIEKIYCKMKGDAFLTDNPSGKARLVDEIRLVDKADWFRVEKISQALLVFKEEAGIIKKKPGLSYRSITTEADPN